MKKSYVLLSLLCMGLLSAVNGQPLNEGKMLLKQGKAKEAIVVLQKAVAASPRNLEALLLLGQAYLQSGRADSAEVLGRKAIDLEDKNPEGYILVSKAALEQKNRQAALQTLKKGLKNNKNNLALLIQLGYFHLATDSADQAVIDFSQAKEADPQSAVAWEGLGDAYASGKPPNNTVAILQYEQAIKIDSTHVEVYKKLSNAYTKDRRWNEAARAYASIVKLDTTDQTALFELGMLYYRGNLFADAANVFRLHTRRFPAVHKGWEFYMESRYRSKRNFAEVVTAAEQVLKADPKSTKAQRMLAHAFYETQQYDRAIAVYKQLASADTLGFDHTRRLADAYARTKQDSLSALTYEAAFKINATNDDAYGEAGAIYMRLRRWERAAEMFEKRFELDPKAVTAYLNYANCNLQLGRIDTARVALRQVVALRADYLPARLSLARCLANARYKTDSLQTALNEFATVIKTADTAVVKYKNELFDAYNGIAYVYYVEKKYPQTSEALDKALKLKPNDAPTRKFKAQILYLMANLEEAAREYRSYLKLNPKDKEAAKELEDVEKRLKAQSQ
jgi:tetratricopeptide (TPR) repeat protein